jgi:hypothetical protein
MLGLALGCLTTLQKRDSQKRLLHSPNGCPSQSDGRGKRHERAHDKTGTLSLRYSTYRAVVRVVYEEF